MIDDQRGEIVARIPVGNYRLQCEHGYFYIRVLKSGQVSSFVRSDERP
jgi:hypothetical protein